MITVRFWGVRGSIAAAGDSTAAVGGNTSCVELRCRAAGAGPGDDQQRIILDAGTGLRALGEAMVREGRLDASLLLSHFHWDHIQGFPFFLPAYRREARLAIYGPPMGGDPCQVREAFERLMGAPHFPVGLEVMPASMGFHGVEAGACFTLGAGGVQVRTAPASHPNGCLAYRVDCGGASVVYATDTEHDPDSGQLDPGLLELSQGADLLIYDAQYTPEEYDGTVGGRPRRGWGHSTAEEGVRLARAAGVGQLVLFHHDPGRDDQAVAWIEARTRAAFPGTLAAREGLELRLEPGQHTTARAA